MCAQGFDRGEVAGKLGLGQRRVDLVVTDLVQPHGRPAFPATQLGREVVQALPDVRGDRSVAQGADRILGHG